MNIMLIKIDFENEAASLYYLQVDKQATWVMNACFS